MTTTVGAAAQEVGGSKISACASLVSHFLSCISLNQYNEEWREKQRLLLEQAQAETARVLGPRWIQDYINPLVAQPGVSRILAARSTPDQIRGAVEYIFLLGRGLRDQVTQENKKAQFSTVINQLIRRNLFNYAALNSRNESYDRNFGETCEMLLDTGLNSNNLSLVGLPPVSQSG